MVSVRGVFVFRFTASDGQLSSSADSTVTFGPDPNMIRFEAENGALVSPFVVENGYIYQSTQTSVSTGGRAAYTFNLSQGGSFVISGLVNAPSESANSLYVNIDAEPVDPTMIWDIPVTSGFESRGISWRGNGDASVSQFVPAVFSLAAGAHTLVIRGREPGVQLDRIDISRLSSGTLPTPPSNLRVVTPF
jgi:hypothetical protein